MGHTRMCKRIATTLLAGQLALALAFGCASGSSGGGAGAGYGSQKHCSSDAECPAGEGCDTEGGSSSDGYCTPLCSTDGECPMKFQCPGGRVEPGDCDEVGDHAGGKGVCDQYKGSKGPNTCQG
jgi:hypothetical protein